MTGEEIYAIEESCCGRGDAVCEMVAKTRAAWGGQLDSALMFYERDCLEASMVELRTSLAELEEQIAARRRALSTNEDTMGEVEGLVVRSPAMRRVLELASRAAHVDSTLLIHGESGVGKERIARFVHDRSARSSGPFVAINCGALPENLLESELSGHAKGAFSGASSDRAGLFEAAHTGTLLLDELGEIPPRLQVMLLRVLEERRVRRLGENHSRPIDVRVLGASHRDLKAMVKDGSFREDLFYRLRVIEVSIPPLRDRLDDILPLARVHLRATAERFGRAVGGLSPAAARALLAHNWPGNVRELANAVERAVVFAEGDQIEAHDLPDLELGENGDTLEGSGSLADVERRHILATLEASGGNRTEAARRLGIGSATLFRKLKAYREA